MGRQARRFAVDGYVLGDDYFTSRNRLLEALEKEGSGKLVHPYLGTLIVVCTGYRLSESTEEGRIARFGMQFSEAGEALFPSAVLNTKKTTQIKKITAYDNIKTFFSSVYSIASVPYSESQRALSTVNQAFALIDEAKKSVNAVASFQRDLLNAKGKALELTYLAEDLIDEVIGLLTFGTDQDDEDFEATADNARTQIQELYRFFEFTPDEGLTGINSPSASLSFAIQQASASAVAGLLTLLKFDSVNEAEEYQRAFLEQIDRTIQQGISDELYGALIDLRTAVMRDIAIRATALPRVVEYTPVVSVPALTLSWALYGTVNMEQDIINRNSVSHPGFVPGSTTLKLLSYV
jgi:prophage DNA circulation protein